MIDKPKQTFPDLRGGRISLVQLDDSGITDMFEYSRDSRFYEFMEFGPHRSIEETKVYLEKLRFRSASGTAHYWFVRLNSSNKVIGTFGVHSIDWRKGCGELGYGLSPAYWKQGYFREALELSLGFLFGDLGFYRISATTPLRNEPSVEALKKGGFIQEGILRDFYLSAKGERYHAALLALLRSDYERKHQQLVNKS